MSRQLAETTEKEVIIPGSSQPAFMDADGQVFFKAVNGRKTLQYFRHPETAEWCIAAWIPISESDVARALEAAFKGL